MELDGPSSSIVLPLFRHKTNLKVFDQLKSIQLHIARLRPTTTLPSNKSFHSRQTIIHINHTLRIFRYPKSPVLKQICRKKVQQNREKYEMLCANIEHQHLHKLHIFRQVLIIINPATKRKIMLQFQGFRLFCKLIHVLLKTSQRSLGNHLG